MKVTLEFNLPEDDEEFMMAKNGSIYQAQIEDIWYKVFRPRHKHGYSSEEINKLLEDPKCEKLMDLLEEIYKEVLHE